MALRTNMRFKKKKRGRRRGNTRHIASFQEGMAFLLESGLEDDTLSALCSLPQLGLPQPRWFISAQRDRTPHQPKDKIDWTMHVITSANRRHLDKTPSQETRAELGQGMRDQLCKSMRQGKNEPLCPKICSDREFYR